MNNKENLINTLIKKLIEEGLYNWKIPSTYNEKRNLLRWLVNIREPRSNEELFEMEDQFLQLELFEKNITKAENLEEVEENISLFKWDITTIEADIIVNAWNEYWLWCFVPWHHCIDNAIHSFAWMRLRYECNQILKWDLIEVWDFIVCDAYNLPSKKVLTTVWPQITTSVMKKDEIGLTKCYENALKYAYENWFKTIVFPSISTWLFAYPIQEARIVAVNTVRKFVKDNPIKVIFNLFSDFDYEQYSELFVS